jgi:hypothetical protein
MNLAIFDRIEVGPDAEITGTVLTPVYEALSAWQPGLGRPKTPRKRSKAQDSPGSPDFQPVPSRIHLVVSRDMLDACLGRCWTA